MTPTLSSEVDYDNDVQTQYCFAQQLNNRGADLLQVSQYKHALQALGKALRISERLTVRLSHKTRSVEGRTTQTKETNQGCVHRHHALDECISSSFSPGRGERRSFQSHHECLDKADTIEHSHRKQISSTMSVDDEQHQSSLCICPLYMSRDTVDEQDTVMMGHMLSLIITFNLALTYQFLALQQQQQSQDNPLSTMQSLYVQKSLRLYNIALRMNHNPNVGVRSIRYMMIVTNNIGQIHHKILQDERKYVLCLEHLLSMMMVYLVIDGKYPTNFPEIEIFLKNTSQILLRGNCANAA